MIEYLKKYADSGFPKIIRRKRGMFYSPGDVNQFIVFEANIRNPAIAQFEPTISGAL
jgi:hypothetical protein